MTDSGSGSSPGSSPGSGSGSGSAFVHVSPALDRERESSFPYAPHSHHWLTTHAFLITALLDLDDHQHGIAYPPTTPEQRRALLNAAPTPLARAQATYYLLRDRALTQPEPEPQAQAQAQPQAHIHPAALAWAANNTLTLSPRQRTLIDALWLIDHAHLQQGTDSLIQLITNTSKASPLHNTLPHHAIHQLFFRLAAHAADERLHPNHVPAPPPAAKRLVTFVHAFHHAGIGQLFAQVNNASSQEQQQQQLPRQALDAYLISLCRVKGLRETWNWLNQRYGDAHAYQSPSSTESIYASLLISVIQSIATPNPLRSQLFEVVYLPLSPSDLQILNEYAIAVPSTRSSTPSNPSTTSRKARAILAEVLFIRYIQSGRYADALALDAQLELQSAHFDPALFDSAHPNSSMDAEGEAHQIDARRKRRADLLRAARDVMPEVQRALLDVRRVRNAVDAAGTSTGPGPVHKKSSTSTNTADDRSWHDVTHEDVSGEGRDDEMELDVDGGTPPAPTAAEHDIVPLTSSAALRGTVPLEKAAAADLSTRSSATAAAVVHASDPQAALISALVSNSVDSAGAGAGRKSQRHRPSFDVSLASTGFRARQSIGGRSSPLSGGGGGGSISRQSPGPGANATPIRSSPFGLRARSSLAGGAPSPSSFGTPRRSTSTLDLVLAGDPGPGAGAVERSERSGSPGMHLAYLFRQPERRFVASVDIPLVSAGGAGAAAGGGDVWTERWAAEQNLRMMDTDDDVIPEHVLQETPMEERNDGRNENENENDAANRTLKRSGRATGNGGAGDDDADTSVRMPGAWDAPEEPSSSSTNNNARGLKKRGAGAGAGAAGGSRVRGDPSGEEGLSGAARLGAKSKTKRGRKAVGTGSEPASSEAEVQPGPTSSTPAARRTTNVLAQPSSQQKQARNPRGRAPPPPSGLRRMTRASSVLSSTSTSSSVVEGSADDEMRVLSDDEVGEVVNEMVEVEGGGIPVVLRRRVARAPATATATAKRVVSGTTATGAGAGTRRSNRLTSTEPGEGEEGETASQSETETETETAGEGEGEGDEVGSQVDESEGESVGGRRRTRRAGAKKVATGTGAGTGATTTTRSKGKKRV